MIDHLTRLPRAHPLPMAEPPAPALVAECGPITAAAWAYPRSMAEPPALAALVPGPGPITAATQVRDGTETTKVLERTPSRRRLDRTVDGLAAACQFGHRRAA